MQNTLKINPPEWTDPPQEMNDEYKIIEAPSLKELQKRVNDAIKEGWSPLGGPFTFPNDWASPPTTWYGQAIEKEESHAQNPG